MSEPRSRHPAHSLRLRLTLAFVAVAVLPTIAVIALLGSWTNDNLEQQALRLREEVAGAVAGEVGAILGGAERQLLLLDDVLALGSLAPADQETALRNLIANDTLYQDLTVVDASGRERFRLSRTGASPDSDLGSRANDEAFLTAFRQRSAYFGPVTFDQAAREPVAILAVPLRDRRSGTVGSVVVATVRFKPIWDLLGQIVETTDGDVYLATEEGVVIAHRNPAVVLSGSRIEVPQSSGRAVGLSGENVVVAAEPLRIGEQELIVVAEQPTTLAFAVATRSLQVAVGVTIVALVVALGLAVLAARRIVRPVEALSASARKIASGDLSHRAELRAGGEIGELAEAFNVMTARLSEAIGTLEDRVRARTLDLDEAAAVQRQLIEELESRNAELEEAREQLEDLMRSKDQFLASVSHELRTPLTSVVGFADELRDRGSEFGEQERQAYIATIADQGREMAHIINDLLVAARDEAGDLVVQPTLVDVGTEIQAVLELWPEVVERVSLATGGGKAFADATRTRQIIRNLVGNAIRYGGPAIEIRVERAVGGVVVEVRDDGEGIPESDWDLIFDPYETAHRGGDQPASVGLGLTVSRLLARRMGGDLAYRYEAGQSVFSLTLPGPEWAASDEAGEGS